MHLPEAIVKILSRFDENGIEAYAVGGAVRDSILLKNPDDFDITTAATPETVREIFKDFKVIDTGIKYGTVTVITDGLSVEVTTYRVETAYSDLRHPDSVAFSKNLKDDLSRRDFTVNAICYHPKFGIYDPFGGVNDINKKIIRTVGDAEKRFSEDAIRILRAIRFASVLGFEIEPSTKDAIFSLAHLLKNISKERIFAEFKKLITGINSYEILDQYFSVLPWAVPNLAPYADKKINFNSLKRLNGELRLQLGAFFISIDSRNAENLARNVLEYLKSDKKIREDTCCVIKQFGSFVPKDRFEIKKLLNCVGVDTALDVIKLWQRFGKISDCDAEKLKLEISEIISKQECYKISQLAIGGTELLKAGIPPERVGKVLNELLCCVMRGECDNENDALIKYISEGKCCI